MNFRMGLFGGMLVIGCSLAGSAQSLDDLNLQIHGYAAQGFLYTTHNNSFYATTSDGSPAWTEAVLNVGLQPTPLMSVGVQARYSLLGNKGNDVTIDWAAVDFRLSDSFGVRAGKVKTPWGLFNETQDLDSSYIWALLPQSVYDLETRGSDLSHIGGVAYGGKELGAIGKVDYRLWGGEAYVPGTDGQFDQLVKAGNGPLHALTNVTLGGALHWRTPLRGLMLGASDGKSNAATVLLQGGSEYIAPWNNVSYFGRYDKRKWMLAAEWNRQASPSTITITGNPIAPGNANTDTRGWYGMATYKLKEKWAVGAYDSQFFDRQAELGPGRYSKDWTASTRYDLNQFVYLKAEQHFVKGTSLNVENDNPRPNYAMTAMRLGVSF